MTKGADNDNVLSSVVAQSQDEGNWPTYGPGSTALATDPKEQSANSDAEQDSDDEDFSGIDLAAPEEAGEAPPPPPPPPPKTVSEVEALTSQSQADVDSVTEDESLAKVEPLAEDESPADEELLAEDESLAEDEPLAEVGSLAKDEPLVEDELLADEELLAEDESLAEDEPLAEEQPLAKAESPAEEAAQAEVEPHGDEDPANIASERKDSERIETVAGPHPDGADFGISDAVPLETLGLGASEYPASKSTALQVYSELRAQEFALARSQRVIGSANPHLFNTQPDLRASVEAGTRRAFAAVKSKPNPSPLTAQPGFLAGLIAAALIGASLYAYLA